ncbi:MAG: tetratricopeptide repeat protein [Promethearchaeota archaeon]
MSNIKMKLSLIEKGKELILKEDYDEALNYFKNLEQTHKDDPLLSNYMGIVYFLKKDYKNAADYFKKAIEQDPENWYPYQKLGQICAIKNIDSCAIKYFTETIERDPGNLFSLLNLALIFQKLDEDLSAELINTALHIDPTNIIGNYLLGTIYLKKNDLKAAEGFFNNILIKDSKYYWALYKLAVINFKNKKYKKAIEYLINALEIRKKPSLYNLLGIIYLNKYKIQDAINSFKDAIKLNPKNASSWINLADAYLRGNRIESSKICLREALDVANTKLQKFIIWTNLGNCYDRLEQEDFSLYCFNRAKELISDDIEKDLEDFEGSELIMEILHDINKKIDTLNNKGIKESKPEIILKEKIIEA